MCDIRLNLIHHILFYNKLNFHAVNELLMQKPLLKWLCICNSGQIPLFTFSRCIYKAERYDKH